MIKVDFEVTNKKYQKIGTNMDRGKCYVMQIYDYGTAGGLVWIDEWNALQHPVAASFLAVVYSDYMLTSRTSEIRCSGKSFTPTDLRNFATSQVILQIPFSHS